MTKEPRGAYGAAYREMLIGNEELQDPYYGKLEYMSLQAIKRFHETLNAISKQITARSILDKFKTKALSPEEEKEYFTLNGSLK
jgi:hypothetical protein